MKSLLTTSIAALMASALWVGAASAAIITNGTVTLGVDDYGQLNVPSPLSPSPVTGTEFTGLRFTPTGNEATSHGCLCEGWGVGIGETLASGSANNDDGVFGLSLVSFVNDASTATSVVSMGGLLEITHAFAPSASANLYSVMVTIENTSGVAISDLRYTRTFDWDVEPTTFTEFVTIGGSAAATSVISAIDNGFVSSDPFAARSTILGGTGDFVDLGPADIGANFDFGFGALGAGESFSFEIFYGAAATEIGAIAALSSVLAEVFSLGQSSCDAAGLGTNCGSGPSNTFMFGFKGVGGVVVPGVPIPAAVIFLMTALGALGGLKLRQRKFA